MWVKLDPHAKWIQQKVQQVLPYQSYNVCLTDGYIFRCNEHHITSWQLFPSKSGADRNKMAKADQTEHEQEHSYNLRQNFTEHFDFFDSFQLRKISQNTQFPRYHRSGRLPVSFLSM